MILKGKVWKFGDYLPMTYFYSGKYDEPLGAGKYREVAPHILEDVNPSFVKKVQRGDLLVVGTAFGRGKHHIGPLEAMRALGIGGIIAKGFAPACEEDAINAGIPALVYQEIYANVETGDVLELDLGAKKVKNLTRGTTIEVKPTPKVIIDILEAGGLDEYTLRRLGMPAQAARG